MDLIDWSENTNIDLTFTLQKLLNASFSEKNSNQNKAGSQPYFFIPNSSSTPLTIN